MAKTVRRIPGEGVPIPKSRESPHSAAAEAMHGRALPEKRQPKSWTGRQGMDPFRVATGYPPHLSTLPKVPC